MKKLSNTVQNSFPDYIKTREHYFKNAQETLRKKEYRKSSELLWGAITQSIKALLSLSKIVIKSHGEFRDYSRRISEESQDPEYHELFLSIERLHRNFYDEQIDPADFPVYYKKALRFLEKNDNLIREKLEKIKKQKNDL